MRKQLRLSSAPTVLGPDYPAFLMLNRKRSAEDTLESPMALYLCRVGVAMRQRRRSQGRHRHSTDGIIGDHTSSNPCRTWIRVRCCDTYFSEGL
jgi:hypothetical protein